MLPSNEAILFGTFCKHGQLLPHSSAISLDALELIFAKSHLLVSLAARGEPSAGSAGSACFLECDLYMVSPAYIGQQLLKRLLPLLYSLSLSGDYIIYVIIYVLSSSQLLKKGRQRNIGRDTGCFPWSAPGRFVVWD